MNTLLLLLIGWSAAAYIPEYSMIASRAAEQHGKGGYQIQQEVTIKKDAEPFTVKETWYVLGENNMRVNFEGKGSLRGLVSGAVIFDGTVKAFLDNGRVRNVRLGEDWVEPFFHFRSSKYFRTRLAALRVTPHEALRDRAPLNSAEGATPRYEPPSFIRLSRVGGSIAWAIGISPQVGSGPTVWIEQDQFVVRKYKSASNIIVKADDYGRFGEGLWYPKSRTYNFGSHTVTVQTLRVRPWRLTPGDALFKVSALKPDQDGLKLPDVDGLQEFFSRFR